MRAVLPCFARCHFSPIMPGGRCQKARFESARESTEVRSLGPGF